MTSSKEIYLFTFIGLALGVLLDILIRNQSTTLFYYAFITLFSMLFALAYNGQNIASLIGSSFAAALLLSLPLIAIKFGFTTNRQAHTLSFLILYPVLAYIVHAFHYAHHHDQTWQVYYSTLFAAVWNTIIVLSVAGLFSAIAEFLIMLGAYAFKSLDYNFLWDWYFMNKHLRIIANSTLFFVGIGVAYQNINIIYSIRFLLLRMMSFLFPILAVISIMYIILYIIPTSTSLNSHYPVPFIILLSLSVLGLIFFNAYFQDGLTGMTPPRWLQILLRIYRVILFSIVLVTFYKLHKELPLNVNVLIALMAMVFFSATYAITAFYPEAVEQEWIPEGNIYTALFFVVALFLVNIPYLPIDFNVGPGNSSTYTYEQKNNPPGY